MKLVNLFKVALVAAAISTLSGCGTINAINNLAPGAGETFMQIWDKWVKADGDIAEATMWEVKVDDGVELQDVIDAINNVGINNNIKNVGELPLSKELNARGIKSDTVYVMSFCNPETARKMLDFSPAMGGFLPCRVTIVGEKDGLHIYSMNMDMAIKMGKKMPPELREATMKVRNTIWEMLQKGKAGSF
ncbi:MAG: DUF302 domain-containing protein [Thiotrichales bacterium]|nr:DUF302 domain-containing protein [Thiotrichales bacterium]